ncbi:hypothetical protein [Streptomyces sp. NPDC017448]|uniref:hypothetical protein n=1 Tax=Streptomyces sp. NPDC017448 TaxID=3364996 RepID=UPI003796FB4A
MATKNLSSGQFPTMGESAIAVNYRQADPGKLVPRNTGKIVPEPDTAAIRPQVQERYGHVGAVQVFRDFSNAPEASATGRNVKPLTASHNGRAAFDTRRTYNHEV